MNIATIYAPWNLQHRGKWTWPPWDDPRGMSGSEMAFCATAIEFAELGHRVTMYTLSDKADLMEGLVQIRPFEDLGKEEHDVYLAWNHPGALVNVKHGLKVCAQMVNSFEYLSREEIEAVDHWISPSEPHRQMVCGQAHAIELDPQGQPKALYEPDLKDWTAVELGCWPNPMRKPKIPGRVIYASSPDRGLHHLLQCWPYIKHKVPHASLRVYYRIQPWIDGFKATPYFPAIEELRQRAVYVEEAMKRLQRLDLDVEVVGSVSRTGIEDAFSEAECFAYPCDTTRWSEGFSCTTLEACDAGACPVIWGTDALGEIYARAAVVTDRGDLKDFTDAVTFYLTDPQASQQNDAASRFASAHRWSHTARGYLDVFERLIS